MLQTEADKCVNQVTEPFSEQASLGAILNREQIIGAGPAYLHFFNIVKQEHEELAVEAKQQHVNP